MNGMRALRNQGGMSLVTAIFILVVLSAIGGYMVLTAGVQSRTTVMALQGARAYHAARSGLEWGINRDLNSGVCVSGSFQVDGYTVTVTCESTAFNEGGRSFTVFRISSLAEWGSYGDAHYISRQLTARVTDVLP
ncbi:pilus assembly protein MshP [Syntrophotalea acetylenivorans]|uniref:Pilus assembly protein MshP n=1 Tax=Syntrophotalea acetylenivorans TaxID=1842532 RepID=A0A1L3GPK6_9BACT|nr:pilus assembly protein MshP [Syntrophotalea acetylenivorans]APG27862.1 pilus assembly protein MshP [Syntrophotalea acetylenivorans]